MIGAAGLATASSATVQDSEEVTIELVVTTPGGDPIGSAEATVEVNGNAETKTTTSNGRVYFDVPAGADGTVSLNHSEYVQNLAHEFDDAASGQTVETTMFEPATGEITVVDTEGEPVEGATVRFRKQGNSVVVDRGDTAADGTFTSEQIEEGTYSVSVKEPGYYDVEQEIDVTGQTNETIEIEAGEVTIDLVTSDPTPEGPGQVSANVAITLDGDEELTTTTREDEPRSVILEVNQNYDVTISKANYSDLTTSLATGESDDSFTFNITREPSISLSLSNERVVVGETLRVEVTDEYDRPVEGASVSIAGETAGETDAQGVANVEIPSAGELEVGAEYDGLSAESATVTGISGSSGDGNGSSDANDSDDGGTGDGSPGFGVVAALVGVLAAVAVLARRR
ncbi:hypothetical protein GCM10028857_21050 [Salinarchaeum chitinilyticum]